MPVAVVLTVRRVERFLVIVLLLLLVAGLAAAAFGHNARREIKQSAGALKGPGKALIGLVWGYTIFVVSLFYLIASQLVNCGYPPSDQASAVASLRTLTTVAISYESTYHGYPQSLMSMGPAPAGKPPDADHGDLID
jgi:hypothetical protein